MPKSIDQIKNRLARESDPDLKGDLERTLINRENQLASLQKLQNMMNRAELQIESTLSSLGTIYSQILTDQSAGHIADYGRLSAQIDEEVYRLQDQLEALWEVKAMR